MVALYIYFFFACNFRKLVTLELAPDMCTFGVVNMGWEILYRLLGTCNFSSCFRRAGVCFCTSVLPILVRSKKARLMGLDIVYEAEAGRGSAARV